MENKNVLDLFNELAKAKESVQWLLDNENGNVDFHDIVYWAERVKILKERIKECL